MKIRTLLMGSAAAALIAVGVNTTTIVTTTEAADVRACDRYGDGFYYLPGSDTCINMSGRVRGHYETRTTESETTAQAGAVDALVAVPMIAPVADVEHAEFVTNARIQFDVRSPSDIGTIRSVARISGDGDGNTTWDALRVHVGSHITVGTYDSFFTRHNGYGHPVANFDGPYPFYSPGAYVEFTGSAGPVDFTVGVEEGVAPLSGTNAPAIPTDTIASTDGLGGGAEDLAFYAGATYAYDGIGSVAVHYLAEANNAIPDLMLATPAPTGAPALAAANLAVSDSTDGEGTLGVSVNIDVIDNLSLKAWYFADDDGQGRIITGDHNSVIAFGGSYTFGDWSIGAGYGVSTGDTLAAAAESIAVDPEQTDLTVELGWNIAPGLKAELAWQSISTVDSAGAPTLVAGATATNATRSKVETDASEVRLRIVRNW